MKNTRHFFLLACILFSSLWAVSFSCSKLEDVEDLEAIKEPLKSPANPRNPFDFVGVEHNRGLEFLGQFPDSIVEYAAYQDDTSKAIEFLSNRITEHLSQQYNLDSLGITVSGTPLHVISTQSPATVIAAQPMSDWAKQQLVDLFTEIDAHPLETTKNINEITDLILESEDRWLNDTVVSESELSICLSGTSVLRYSLFFWVSLLYDETRPWSVILDQIEAATSGKTKKEKIKRAWCIAAWDAGGAVVGGVGSGTPIGAVALAIFNSAFAAEYICK